MAKIIIGTVPIHGHVTPLLAVAKHLVQRGDSVRWVTGARFAQTIAKTGATHIALPADSDYDDRVDWNDYFPERAGLKGRAAIAFDIEHIFIRPGYGHYETIMREHQTDPADVVICDPAFAGGALLTGLGLGERPPLLVAGLLPLMLASRDVAPFGMGLRPAPVLNRLRNRLLAEAAKSVMKNAEALATEQFRAIHGTDAPNDLMNWIGKTDAIAQFTVPDLEYPRADAPPTLHFVGPVNATGSNFDLPDWWGDLDGSRPVVHVTQGTIANQDYSQLIEPTLRALAGEDVIVVVATGGRPIGTLPALPENARAAEFLPYDDLLPKTDVFVTNGGYGGVNYALRYGVPIVATGGQEDKPEVGARVAWSGVGRRLRTDRPSKRALRREITRILTSPRYRDAATRMADRMEASPGLAGLEKILDGLITASKLPR